MSMEETRQCFAITDRINSIKEIIKEKKPHEHTPYKNVVDIEKFVSTALVFARNYNTKEGQKIADVYISRIERHFGYYWFYASSRHVAFYPGQ